MGKSSPEISEKNKVALAHIEEELRTTDFNASGNMLSASGHQQLTTRVGIVNNGKEEVKYQDHKDWSGKVYGSYPQRIPASRSRKFLHQGINAAKGSKGAVMYVGPSNEGSSVIDCAYILAWSTLGTKNQIYVETGPKGSYVSDGGKVSDSTWDSIQDSLDASGSTSSFNDDDNTGAEASAQTNEVGDSPNVSTMFDISLPIN